MYQARPLSTTMLTTITTILILLNILAPSLITITSATVVSRGITLPTSTSSLEGHTCETIQVPMCKGLISYNTTILPNRLGHRTQAEVYWALQPWWPFIDDGCSDNLRRFLCGLYLPKCMGDGQEPHYPCSETCRKAKVRCSKQMRRENMRWLPEFQCHRFLPKTSRTCIRPQREKKKNKNRQYVLCEENNLPLCHGIPFTQGSLPNMFLQGDLTEIEQEMAQFRPLMESGCSRKLRLFVCGVYMPFCVSGVPVEDTGNSAGHHGNADPDGTITITRQHSEVPFVVPCRELCQEVYDQCSGEYQQRTNGLPWPAKFHCHRYPSYADRYNDTIDSNGGARVSCTMPPYNYDGH